MGEAFLDQKKSSGINLNDVIEEFKYVYKGQTIKAGDLVNYINGVAGQTTSTSETTNLSSTAQTGYCTSAVQLDENRVFIAYNYSTSYDCLYGIVVTVDGTAITAGTDTALVSVTNAGKAISATLLPNGNVFIAHSYGSSYYLYGIVCSINGTTISKGTDTKILGDTNAGYVISAETLPDGEVFIAHSITSNYKLCGIVCTISNKTITVGTDTALSSTNYSGKAISTVLLESGYVFIAHCYDSSYYLRGMVCSVSGTTISAGTDTALVNSSMAGSYISATLLSSGKVLVAHSMENTPLYAMVITVSNKSISKGTNTSLVSTSEASFKLSALGLANEKAFISHYGGDEGYLNGIIVSVDGTAITKGTDTQLSTANYSSCGMSTLLLPSGDVFVSHGSGDNSVLHAQVFGIDETNNIPTNEIVVAEYETQITPAIEPPFNAIALSSGVGAEMVESEVTKTGNIFPENNSEWTEIVEGTKSKSADGYMLEASSTAGSSYVHDVCNEYFDSPWQSSSESTPWVMMTCPEPTKITKMKIRVSANTTSKFSSAIIQGSKNGDSWTDLHTITAYQQYVEEITLQNVDFYNYYKITVTLTTSGTSAAIFYWQTSEYIAIEQIPSTEHNEQVKIARLPIELIKTGNIFAKNWTEVSETECTADDGSKLTASSSHSSSLSVYSACDGNVGTYWYANQTHTNTQLSEVLIELPNACKITKMKTYITTNDDDGNVGKYFGYATIKGTKGNGEWVDLYTIGAVQTELTEISLENADEYIAYKIEISTTAITKYVRPRIYEWQTSEYVEVI